MAEIYASFFHTRFRFQTLGKQRQPLVVSTDMVRSTASRKVELSLQERLT
jgi:hypothetical protein